MLVAVSSGINSEPASSPTGSPPLLKISLLGFVFGCFRFKGEGQAVLAALRSWVLSARIPEASPRLTPPSPSENPPVWRRSWRATLSLSNGHVLDVAVALLVPSAGIRHRGCF